MWISHKFLSIFGMISRNENLHLSYACVVCVRLFSHTMQCFNVDLCYSYSSCSCDNIRYNCVVHFVFQECVISVRAHRHKAKKLEKKERRRNINFWAFGCDKWIEQILLFLNLMYLRQLLWTRWLPKKWSVRRIGKEIVPLQYRRKIQFSPTEPY